ncbi:hypothetical protein MRX96_003261 [Rhipicephalus microplus]
MRAPLGSKTKPQSTRLETRLPKSGARNAQSPRPRAARNISLRGVKWASQPTTMPPPFCVCQPVRSCRDRSQKRKRLFPKWKLARTDEKASIKCAPSKVRIAGSYKSGGYLSDAAPRISPVEANGVLE